LNQRILELLQLKKLRGDYKPLKDRGLPPRTEIRLILSENVPIAAIVLLHFIAVYVIHAVLGIHDRIAIVFHFNLFTQMAIVFSGLFLIPHVIKKSYHRYFTLRYICGFLTIFLLTPVFISTFASFKQTLPKIHDFHFDTAFMQMDYFIHFGRHPWELLSSLLAQPWIIRTIDALYMLWFVLLAVFGVWMAWTQRRRLRICFFASILAVWIFLGQGMAVVFSSAGPCYFSKIVKDGEDPFQPLMSRLSEIHLDTTLWALNNQEGLWYAMWDEETWLPFGGISAMPSIHVAIATLFVLLTAEIRKWLAYIFAGYLVITQIGSVILGWHYAVDGYVSIILTCFIWYVIRYAVRQYTYYDGREYRTITFNWTF